MLTKIKKLIPKQLFQALQPIYHHTLSTLGAIIYRFPSRELYVVGVTGTKGKSSTTEIINHIFETAGFSTSVTGTIRFKLGNEERENLYKMSMPGRFFMHSFLREAVQKGVTHAVIEMTSEGAKLYRHAHIDMDAFVFTNLSPEHIESHGSFENYRDAKLRLRDSLVRSKKQNKVVVANADDEYGAMFLDAPGATQTPYSMKDVSLKSVMPNIVFTYKDIQFTSPLQGEFNVLNLLAAIKVAEHAGVSLEVIKTAVASFSTIPGRVQHIEAGQPFDVVVDYAHTAESLEALYGAFKDKHKVCVLGSCGGGRDTWKRPKMAKIAEQHCDEVILTNEDPYDEDPVQIVEDMIAGMENRPEVIMDRREAIAEALRLATDSSAVLITGKGTDPYIMEANDTKTPWSDARVAKEELEKLS